MNKKLKTALLWLMVIAVSILFFSWLNIIYLISQKY
jgi:hypothetical protein